VELSAATRFSEDAAAFQRSEPRRNCHGKEGDAMKSVFAVTLIAMMVAGCSTVPPNNQPVVKVAKGVASVTPDPIRIMSGVKAPITWQIDESATRYRFADDGVVVAGELQNDYMGVKMDAPAKPQSEIVNCRRSADGRQFQCDNKNTRMGIYKYLIKLLGPDGKAVAPLESLVVNTDRG
jgi:hypothetical protein